LGVARYAAAILGLLRQAQQQATERDDDWHASLNLLARMLLNAGYTDDGRACAHQALTLAGTHPPRRAAALVSVAHLGWARERDGDAIKPLLEEAHALAGRADRPEIQADAARALAIVVHVADRDAARAEDLFARAGALYRAAGKTSSAHRVQLLRVPQLCDLGRLDEAREVIGHCEAYFRALQSTADLMCVANLSGILAAEQAQWHDAAAARTGGACSSPGRRIRPTGSAWRSGTCRARWGTSAMPRCRRGGIAIEARATLPLAELHTSSETSAADASAARTQAAGLQASLDRLAALVEATTKRPPKPARKRTVKPSSLVSA
jgi:hypothetical protein